MASIFLPKHSEDRLGYDETTQPVLSHAFFADIDIYSLYEGYGPLYPDFQTLNQLNPTITGSSDMYHVKSNNNNASTARTSTGDVVSLFTLLSNQEMNEIPDFAGRYAREKEEEDNANGVGAEFRALYYEGFEDFTYYS